MSNSPFPDRARIDAHDKVCGRTTYSADLHFPGLLHAMTVPSTIAKGWLTEIDGAAALAVPGVIRVLTPADMPSPGDLTDAGRPLPMLEAAIAHLGQPIALVVAETIEAAVAGAGQVRATYREAPFTVAFDDPQIRCDDTPAPTLGNADAAFAGAAVTIEATYTTAANHHNPLELLSTTAVWNGGKVTIYEGTQASNVVKASVARSLRVAASAIDVVSRQVGGGFGQRGEVQRHTALVAHAARLVGRPVKFVMPRSQIFHNARFRPNVRHTVKLGATAEGRIVSAHYDTLQQNSRRGGYRADWYHAGPSRIYGIANYKGTSGDLRLDTPDPGQMRAPFEHPAAFAFESAVDELACRLRRDPIELRMLNDTKIDPQNGKWLTSRTLNACMTRGAARFGWSRRSPEPRSMQATDGAALGYGMAAGVYQAAMHPAIATLRVSANGATHYASAGHEMGQGLRTTIAQALLAHLPIDESRLSIVVGDTSAAPQHVTAGSWGTASSVPVAIAAAERMNAAMNEFLDGRVVPGNMHEQLARLRRPYLEVEVAMFAPGQGREHVARLRSGGTTIAGLHGTYPDFTCLSYIAHFVEVCIDRHTRQIRVPRVVSVADCGRVVSPRTARSQLHGGVVWALGAALREKSEVDARYGGWLNADLGEYFVPVNADIGEIEVELLDQPDYDANSAGVKSLGEIAMVGVAAAVTNAIFHATGVRVRHLPVRLEQMLL